MESQRTTNNPKAIYLVTGIVILISFIILGFVIYNLNNKEPNVVNNTPENLTPNTPQEFSENVLVDDSKGPSQSPALSLEN